MPGRRSLPDPASALTSLHLPNQVNPPPASLPSREIPLLPTHSSVNRGYLLPALISTSHLPHPAPCPSSSHLDTALVLHPVFSSPCPHHAHPIILHLFFSVRPPPRDASSPSRLARPAPAGPFIDVIPVHGPFSLQRPSPGLDMPFPDAAPRAEGLFHRAPAANSNTNNRTRPTVSVPIVNARHPHAVSGNAH